MLRVIPFVVAASFAAVAAAQHPRVGETYELKMVEETLAKDNHGGDSSSYDRDTLIERIIAVRPDGVELEYDLPKAVTAEERASDWKLPVRLFKPNGGPLQLVNSRELEARLDRWLKDAKWTRAICGHWIFTWNAFQIDCDPQNAIKIVEDFDLTSTVAREGASYKDPQALAAGTLKKESTGLNGAVFTVEMQIDPGIFQSDEARTDVVVGEISGKPVTFDAALRERLKESVSGTIAVKFETDANGGVVRRTRVSKIEIKDPNGQLETRTITQTLERRQISEH
jgi:hypothetical protein